MSEKQKMNENEKEVTLIPYGVLELMQDRYTQEKLEMMKHYRTIIAWLIGIIALIMIAIFGSAVWFLTNYDISTYSQDGNGFNNFIGDCAVQGDLEYVPEDKNY